MSSRVADALAHPGLFRGMVCDRILLTSARERGCFLVCVNVVGVMSPAPPKGFPEKTSGAEPRSRKEVFQPHLPVRLPCYDLAPITSFALGRSLRSRTLGAPGFHGLTGGVYKARERIHRAMADARLLANPASRSRVADSDPN